jgi:hypothetical protein
MPRLLLAVSLAGLATAAPIPKDFKQAGDKELLVGTWQPTDNGTANFRFHADGTLQTWSNQNAASPVGWTWTNLDPTATPKRVTLTRTVGSGSYDCIYELTADTLRLAFILDKTKPIPDKPQAGPGFSFYNLAREKPAK